MIPKMTSQDAERALEIFATKYFEAVDCRAMIGDQKIYSRLLFQSAAHLAKITETDQVAYVEARTRLRFRIHKDNLGSHDSFKGRQKIKPDIMAINRSGDCMILGEAKGTQDRTGESGSRTFSCAHKISWDLLSECNSVGPVAKGFTHSFLSQSLGYLDAVAHHSISAKNPERMLFVWLLCEGIESPSKNYRQLGDTIGRNIDKVFPAQSGVIKLIEVVENDILKFLIFDVYPHKISGICNRMTNEFVGRYFCDTAASQY